jgi:hypothetical protein
MKLVAELVSKGGTELSTAEIAKTSSLALTTYQIWRPRPGVGYFQPLPENTATSVNHMSLTKCDVKIRSDFNLLYRSLKLSKDAAY